MPENSEKFNSRKETNPLDKLGEDLEELLEIKVSGNSSAEDIKRIWNYSKAPTFRTFSVAITPGYDIVVSHLYHSSMYEKDGFSSPNDVAEGYVAKTNNGLLHLVFYNNDKVGSILTTSDTMKNLLGITQNNQQKIEQILSKKVIEIATKKLKEFLKIHD